MSLSKASSLAYVDTIYSADSIEWCPFSGFQDLFVCGTYQIIKPEEKNVPERSRDEGHDDSSDEEEQAPVQTQRVGRLLLFKVQDDQSLEEVQRIETPAILDTKWSPRLEEGGPRLAVADAKGHITIYELNRETIRLVEVQSLEIEDETKLCLSLDFSHRSHPNNSSPAIITSISNGSLAHLTPSPSGYSIDSSWHAHDFEPWITAFDWMDPMTIWSGGDDCKLKRWDLRGTSMPTMVNKNFDAGVTTITPSPHTPNLLAVGSYDENLRFFDTRSPREPLLTVAMGGGIWRTRFHPHPERANDVLVASMHDGFKVLRLGEDVVKGSWAEGGGEEMAGDIVKTFEEHTSLAYGADWSRLPVKDGQSLVATSSFYDHAMHLWQG